MFRSSSLWTEIVIFRKKYFQGPADGQTPGFLSLSFQGHSYFKFTTIFKYLFLFSLFFFFSITFWSKLVSQGFLFQRPQIVNFLKKFLIASVGILKIIFSRTFWQPIVFFLTKIFKDLLSENHGFFETSQGHYEIVNNFFHGPLAKNLELYEGRMTANCSSLKIFFYKPPEQKL